MNKHNKNNGFHVLGLMAAELIITTLALTIFLKSNFISTVLVLTAFVVAMYYAFKMLRNISRQLPTALGYSDLAKAKTKKAALSSQIKPAPKRLYT